MQYAIMDAPDFGLLRVDFEAAGEHVVAEAGAMVSRSDGVEMSTNMRGGLGSALKRRVLGGESMFQNTFTATGPGQHVLLAPGPEGDLSHATIPKGDVMFLQSGNYMAHTGEMQLDTKWGGAKSFFGGVGFFMLKCIGPGELFFNSYGALHAVDVGPDGYTVDTGHIVAFTEGLDFSIRKFGGFKGLFFSGEGLIAEFRGEGTVFVQTRNAPALANFLEPFRRVRRSSN